MTVSRRSRREWRIFLWMSLVSALVSAVFSYLNSASGLFWIEALRGVASSLVIATPIMLFELKGYRVAALHRLRRLPLVAYFALKFLFYVVVIVGGLVLIRVVFATGAEAPAKLDVIFTRALGFAVAMSIFGNLIFVFGGLLGLGTLKNLLTGRYVQPRREERAFLLIDMKNSTGVAERLGPVRFHALLNDFFRNVSDAALECDAEIHKYVGDEAILTWPDDDAVADNDCLACAFVARDRIAVDAYRYRRRYGVVPEFRAALHRGEIIAGEIGDVRREIAYVSDTLNVAARLLDAAKQLGRDVLVSTDLLERTTLPEGVKAEKLPTLKVRGREAPLEIAALELS